jgi:uncharacterized membrane protein HdeD (DUF308 family)
VLGILLFVMPIVGALVLAFWIGVYEIAFGLSLLMLAFTLRRRAPRTRPLQPEARHA